MTPNRRLAAALLLLPLAALAQGAAALPYPSKPIALIVPYGAGGGADVIARAVAKGSPSASASP